MQRQRRLKLAAVLVAMAMAAGCAATLLMGVGGLAALGTYKWVEGTMEKDYPRPMKETFDAAMEGARKLNLKISTEQYTPSESKILASTQDGRSKSRLNSWPGPTRSPPSRSASACWETKTGRPITTARS